MEISKFQTLNHEEHSLKLEARGNQVLPSNIGKFVVLTPCYTEVSILHDAKPHFGENSFLQCEPCRKQA